MTGNKRYVVIVTLMALLAITSIVYAAHTTIATDDKQVDPNWAYVPLLINDGDDVDDDDYDIDQGWAANASDNSGFYFRVNMIGAGPLPGEYGSLEARLDCDHDGNFQEDVDVVVYYDIYNGGDGEMLMECQGNIYGAGNFCNHATPPPPGVGSDYNPDTFGEVISGTPYNYEWRADAAEGEVDWSHCLGQIDVQFTSLDQDLTVKDNTAWHRYNVPTSVQLKDFSPQRNHWLMSELLAAILISILLIGSWLVLSLRKR